MPHIHADGSEEFGPRERRTDEVASQNYRAGGICRRRNSTNQGEDSDFNPLYQNH